MIFDLPTALQSAVSISWTMEHNHALAASPFSGHVQAQRGQMERWSFTMQFQRMGRAAAQEAMGFFMRLEGNLHTFRMYDPAGRKPLGVATGAPILAENVLAGARTVATQGWQPNVPGILKAGDWVQIGDNFARLRADADSSPTGTATLDLWPKLMTAAALATPVIVRDAKGIFRFTSDFPSWAVEARSVLRPFQISMTGVQEILQ